MDYKKWLEGVDTKNPQECVNAISDLIKENIDPEQKLYAIQLLVHDSALVYNNQLKNKNELLKHKINELEKQMHKKVVVKVKK